MRAARIHKGKERERERKGETERDGGGDGKGETEREKGATGNGQHATGVERALAAQPTEAFPKTATGRQGGL